MTIYGLISMHVVTVPTPEASTAAPKFRTWKLNELIEQGQFTLGKKLVMGATNIANVVTVEGVRYAGKRPNPNYNHKRTRSTQVFLPITTNHIILTLTLMEASVSWHCRTPIFVKLMD